MRMHRELLADETSESSDDQVYELLLPKSGVLSALDIKFQATNGTTSNKADATDKCLNAVMEVVEKIEVVADGSNVLFSMGPKQIIALAHYLEKRRPAENLDENASAKQYNWFPIRFGRKIGDKSYALDLSKYREVKLKINYDLAAVRAVSATTAFATGTSVITVVGHRWITGKAPSPRGFLRSTEIKSFTTAASGDKVIDMPQKYNWKNILVYCRENEIADDVDISKIQLDVNNEGEIIFKSNWNDAQELQAIDYEIEPTVKGLAFASDTDKIYTYTGTCKTIAVNILGDVDITADTVDFDRVDTITGDAATLNSSTADITAGSEDLTANVTDHTIFWVARGVGVGNAVLLDFDKDGEMDNLFDSRKYDDVNLTLTQAAADGTCKIVLTEIVV